MVAIGGYNTIDQAKALAKKPHVVIATPGRLRALMEGVEIAAAFSRTKVCSKKIVVMVFSGYCAYQYPCAPLKFNNNNLFSFPFFFFKKKGSG